MLPKTYTVGFIFDTPSHKADDGGTLALIFPMHCYTSSTVINLCKL